MSRESVMSQERSARSRPRARISLILCLAAIASCVLAAQASAAVFWTNTSAGTIGRAADDGSAANENFISGLNGPTAIAVDSKYIYWTAVGSETIGRAKLDGTEVQKEFITGVEVADGIAVDSGHIYWTTEGTESIERANLQGGEREEISEASEPRAIAVSGGYVYWTENKRVSRVKTDGSEVERPFVTVASLPHGLAADSTYLYVAQDQTGQIARVTIGSKAVEQNFISGQNAPVATAVNAEHLYWGSGFNGSKAVSRANLDGSDVRPTLIQGTEEIVGVAVTPSVVPVPPTPTPTPTPDPTPIQPAPTSKPGATPPASAGTTGPLRLIKLKRNRHVGLGRLRVHAPAAGGVTIFGKGVRTAKRTFAASGNAFIKVVPKGAYRARLLSHHRGFTRVKIKFHARDGSTSLLVRRMRLVKR